MASAPIVFDLERPRAQGGSRILTQWMSAREAERRQLAAHREQVQAMAAFRRIHRTTPGARAARGTAAGAAEPAFPVVSGQRAFDAGSTDRLTAGWASYSTGINADLEGALPAMVARSRSWVMNTDLGARYLELVADNIVGADAPRLQVRATLADGAPDEAANLAVEQAWADWCRRGCEVTGQLTFADVCRQVVQTTARDGEYLGRKVSNRRLRYGFQLQLLDVDRLDFRLNAAPAAPGANCIRMGVEVDALGRKVGGHLLSYHPGDPGSSSPAGRGSEFVPAEQLLHGFVSKRPEQIRGYPWTAPTLKRTRTLDSFEAYALTAAKFGAAKMGFYTVDKEVVGEAPSWDDIKDATGELVQDIEEGLLEALPPGVGFEAFDPKYPEANFAPFVTEYKRDIAMGLNVAHHNLTGNMNGVNYSSARIAELTERRSWRALQRWFIDSFVMSVFGDWLKMALLTGSVRLPSGAPLPADRFEKFFTAASFQSPGWAWVDPEADIKAGAMALTYDLRSLRSLTDEQGVDLEQNLADKVRLKAKYEAAGLPVPAWLAGGPAVMATGGAPSAPAPKQPGASA